MSSQKDLELLERVFLRFGLADTDEKLKSCISRFLCPVLLKLSTPYPEARKKAVELLTHISKRLKSRPAILLPAEDLLVQYENHSLSPIVHNFTIVYMRMAILRLTLEERNAMVPRLVRCLENRPKLQQDNLLHLIVQLLAELRLPETSSECKEFFGIQKKTAIRDILLDCMLKVLLLPTQQSWVDSAGSTRSMERGVISLAAGVSTETYFHLMSGPNAFDVQKLTEYKVGIVKFLGSGTFEPEHVACHLLVASGNSFRSLASSAISFMKTLIGPNIWERPEIVAEIYKIFLGTDVLKSATSPDFVCPPADAMVQLHMLPYLMKSKEAALQAGQAMRLVLLCVKGTTGKLMEQGLRFLHHVCENATTHDLEKHANQILSLCYEISKSQESGHNMTCLAFATFGKLSRRVAGPFRKETSLIRHMFTELAATESPDLRQSIYDSLMSCIPALASPDDDASEQYTALVQDGVKNVTAQVRVLALQFSCGVFGISHLPTAELCLRASGDSDEMVRQTASRALFGVGEDRSAHGRLVQLPVGEKIAVFEHLLVYLIDKCQQKLQVSQGHTVSSGVLPFSPIIFRQMLSYLHGCLLRNAGVTNEQLLLGAYQDTVAKHFNSLQLPAADVWQKSWQMTNYVLSLRSLSGEVHSCGLAFIVDICFARPQMFGQEIKQHFPLLKEFLGVANEDVRSLAARLLAVIAVSLNSASLVTFCTEVFNLHKEKGLEAKCGALQAMGNIMSSLQFNVNGPQVEIATGQLATDVTMAICTSLGSASNPLFLASCQALGDFASCFALPIRDGSDEDPHVVEAKGSPPSVKLLEVNWSKLEVIKSLSDRIVKSTDSRIQERAALSLGSLLLGEQNLIHYKLVLDGLMSAKKLQQAEVQFVIGEALSFVAVGRHSSAAPRSPLSVRVAQDDEDSVYESCPHIKETLAAVLKLCKAEDETTRQSACVWLLSLIKHCGHVPAMQEYLVDIQTTFIAMLTERSDIVQEVASRGLSLVFDHSPHEQRDGLVEILRDTLLKGRRSGRHVDKKTKILGDDVIGKQSEGAGVSTYEELCSMANDLNQPDLVYKFMNLANHHAIWNSKKGAAFGVSFIAEHCKEALQEHLGSIIPKLYHYQYDPNVKVQLAMTNIWKSIVNDPQKAVIEYFGPILTELRAELVNAQWRTRQSCCLALADFLRGVTARKELIDALPDLWTTCLRVRDDIKESVRTAADSACTSLSKFTVRACDSSHGDSGKHAIELVLPVLLEKGMQSSVAEVKTISLATILQLAKNAGPLLGPHISVMVPLLLEGLTELEPKVLSYIALHIGADSDEMQDKLDTARISASKISPLMEVVKLCLYQVDKDNLGSLVGGLVPLLKSGIGLGTKAGTADVVVMLCRQVQDDIMPYAGKLLAALLHGLSDRSSGVRRSYASCTGHVVKNAKESSVEKLIERMRTWYMEKEDEELHHSAALVLHAISRHSPDVLQRHSSAALPLVFLAMHAKPKPSTQTVDEANSLDTLSLWQEVWQENTPGTEGGIRVNHKELIALTNTTLTTSSSWLLKRQAAVGASVIAQKLGSGLSPDERNTLLKSLLSVVDGRMWDGKDAVYQAVADMASIPTKDTPSTSAGTEVANISNAEIVDCMLSQCKKRRYRREALQSMGRILSAVSIDRLCAVFEVVAPIVAQSQKQKSDSEDSDSESTTQERRSEKELLRAAAFTVIGQAWPSDLVSVEVCEPMIDCILSSLPSASWRVKVAILNCITSFASKCDPSAMDEDNKSLILAHGIRLLPAAAEHLTDAKFTAVQAGALKSLENLLALCKYIPLLDDMDIKQRVHQQLMAMLKLSSASSLHGRCKALRQKYFTLMH